jgi:hypothetical protein
MVLAVRGDKGHLRSYLATATGINLLDALIQLTSGQPWIPAVS